MRQHRVSEVRLDFFLYQCAVDPSRHRSEQFLEDWGRGER